MMMGFEYGEFLPHKEVQLSAESLPVLKTTKDSLDYF